MHASSPIRIAATLALVAALAAPGLAGAQSATTEARLRDQLRQTITELRSLQDENANLKAQVTAAQQQLAAEAAKPAASVTPPEDLRRLEGSLKTSEARTAELQRRSDQMDQALAQWRQGYEQAATAYRTRDADAKRLEAALAQSTADGKTCRADNAQLVSIGQELVARYKDKSLGDWVKDREPLTQLGSVQFESLAQAYHVKVTDLAVPPPAAAP